jgi:hypothetical protein
MKIAVLKLVTLRVLALLMSHVMFRCGVFTQTGVSRCGVFTQAWWGSSTYIPSRWSVSKQSAAEASGGRWNGAKIQGSYSCERGSSMIGNLVHIKPAPADKKNAC